MIRRIVPAAFACCLAAPAFAQPRSYSVTLTDAEMSIVARALGRQPYDEAAPVIARLSQQIQAQAANQKPSGSPSAEEPKAREDMPPAQN